MEDRQDAGLWLEADPEDARAEKLRAGGLRVTEFLAARPYAEGMPRKLDDFGRLLVAEMTTLADLPDIPGKGGWGFRRYPRPSQGICTGLPTLGLLLVLISVREGQQAQALRDWADFIHLRHIAACAVPGFTTITPYECITHDRPKFLHLYEMDTADPGLAYDGMTPLVIQRLGGGPGHPPFDEWANHPALRIEFVNVFTRTSTT